MDWSIAYNMHKNKSKRRTWDQKMQIVWYTKNWYLVFENEIKMIGLPSTNEKAYIESCFISGILNHKMNHLEIVFLQSEAFAGSNR